LGSVVALSFGCAPVAMMRPPGVIGDDRSFEAGSAVASLGKRPYVEESAQYTGQAWFSADVKRWLTLSGIAAFDTSAAAVGGAARWNALRTGRFTVGPELEFGYAWTAASLGGSVRVIGRNYVYTAPRFGTMGSHWSVGVPAGVSIDLTHGFALRAEGQLSWQELKYYNRRLHLAAGLAYQF
ncbi:MAG TPA: hypothetical protein VFQ35_15145, partial [Polyangiaceae bacterium]|nr:hypothetical protein [Polyangiaceae bacterium]